MFIIVVVLLNFILKHVVTLICERCYNKNRIANNLFILSIFCPSFIFKHKAFISLSPFTAVDVRGALFFSELSTGKGLAGKISGKDTNP